MTSISTIRHLEVFDPSKHNKIPVCIIGAGATGSRVFAALVELGLTNIRVYDFDVVEQHNLANQIYLAAHVGKSKVSACEDWQLRKTNHKDELFKYVNAKLPSPEHMLQGVVFLLTDSMQSRRDIYEQCIKDNDDIFLVIETRMASSYGNVFCFDPSVEAERNEWLASLIDDDKAEVSACGTSISVGTTASLIANLAVWQYMLWATDQSHMNSRINMFMKPFIFKGFDYVDA